MKLAIHNSFDKSARKPYGLLNLFLAVMLLFLVACGSSDSTNSDTSSSQQTIQNKGSDTLVNVALAWAEAYHEVEPDVSIAVTGGGSGTGIAALINNTVDIANASRAMSEDEIEQARAKGIEPVEHVVAIDALAIIVNLENPIEKLTIQQLANMYTGKITNWNEVGGSDAPIVLLSRETNSGTHVYFLEEVVRQGDEENTDIFAPQTLLMPSSVGITSEVRRNPNAIGYDGLGYVDAEHEKIIAIAADSDSDFIMPTVETASEGAYPLARDLYMYTAGEASGALADYLNWILSSDGQDIVASLGFVPLTEN
ncbi:MAG: phosphate ABC transporter substrate-binding protein [Candidatus Promineifilaceae bacterium]|jgi:phosphate transport system substrate-binding protein